MIVLAALTFLAAVDLEPKPRVESRTTAHFDLPAGGTIRVNHSVGELDVEAWDGAGVEVTTIKSAAKAAALDRVQVKIERTGGDLNIAAEFPKRNAIERAAHPADDFDLEIHVKAPKDAKLEIDHQRGEVNLDGMTGDIHAVNGYGDIAVHLPDGAYAIDAQVDHAGAVTSDFPGTARGRHWLGETFEQKGSAPAPNLYLRLGWGDIIVEKQRRPAPPAPLAR